MNDGNVTVYLGAFFALYERGSVRRIEMIVYIPTSQKSRTNRLMSTKQKIPAYKKQQKPVLVVVVVL